MPDALSDPVSRTLSDRASDTVTGKAANAWRRLIDWLRRLVRPRPVPEPYGPPLPEGWAPPQPPAVIRPRAERYPAMRLRQDILNQLDKYQVYVKRLKRYDRETYETYRRLGAYVVDRSQRVDSYLGNKESRRGGLSGSFLRMLPGFGGVAYTIGADEHHAHDKDDYDPYIACRFSFFTKVTRVAPGVQLLNSGTTYRLRFYWDDKIAMSELIEGRDRGFSQDMLVNIDDDGTVRPLRVLKNHPQQIRHKQGVLRGSTTTIHHQRWALPNFGDEKNPWCRKYKVSREDFLIELFVLTANSWITGAQQSMIRVTATKDNIVMPFVVDALKTPQFFADRDKVITQSGRAAPIFHVVRTHERRGRAIKMHFAGLRDFQWNGYQVKITVPGKDHLVHDEFPGGVREDASDDEKRDPETASPEAIADMLADYIGAPARDAAE